MRVSQTSQFKRDIRKQIKKGKSPDQLLTFIRLLQSGAPLPAVYKDHPLRGNWSGRRDCHLEPDWILIHRLGEDELRLERTGSHSDLF